MVRGASRCHVHHDVQFKMNFVWESISLLGLVPFQCRRSETDEIAGQFFAPEPIAVRGCCRHCRQSVAEGGINVCV